MSKPTWTCGICQEHGYQTLNPGHWWWRHYMQEHDDQEASGDS